MNKTNIIFFLIDFIFLSLNLFFCFKVCNIKKQKNETQQKYLLQLEKNIKNLQFQYQKSIKNFNDEIINYKKEKQREIQQQLCLQQELAQKKIQECNNKTKQKILASKDKLQIIKEEYQEQKQKILKEINKLKSSLNAGIAIRIQEQQKKNKINFYKLSISETDLADVKILENLKTSLHKPVILSKLIWTQYFQKQMTQLCDRVLNKKAICGIYKITNLLTDQCYIGQSLDIASRWKAHCKCGLGIDASSTNKLYNSMQKNGVWNFTFELLEQCPKEQLNEKEKFWIQMYQSDKFGLNILKGNKV